MADDWIKIRIDLFDDPNVFIMSDILSLNVPTVVGHLVTFWGWMDKHTPDGTSLKLSDSVIDKRIGVDGFAIALRQVGWLEGKDWALDIPKFDRHNGNSAKARSLEAEAKRLRRKEKEREQAQEPPPPKDDDPPPEKPQKNVGQLSDKKPRKSPTREEKRREEKEKEIPPISPQGEVSADPPPPPDGSNPEKPKFAAKRIDLPPTVDPDNWVRWCEFRSSKRKPISEQAARQQIAMLAEHPPDAQRAIVQNSIQNDYQGLFAPKGGSHAERQSALERRSELASHYYDFDKATNF